MIPRFLIYNFLIESVLQHILALCFGRMCSIQMSRFCSYNQLSFCISIILDFQQDSSVVK